MASMADNIETFDFADNPSELGVQFNTGINLEIRLSNTILARMANENYETTFNLGYDPAHGVIVRSGISRWAPLNEDPISRLAIAPLPGPRESRLELRTTAETAASNNNSEPSEDVEDAATVVPAGRPQLPDQGPLVPDHPRLHTASTGRVKAATADSSRSSPHTAPKVSGKPSSSTSRPVSVQTQDNDPDETEDEDWKEMGVDRLLRAARPDLIPRIPEHPYAPTATRPNTQGSGSRDQRAAVGSSRESGGRRGRKKRGRDEDTDPVKVTRVKKTKG